MRCVRSFLGTEIASAADSARVQALAEDVFGDAVRANRWLRKPLGEPSGTVPLEWARTEAGARLVEQLLAKIDWGAAA